MSTICYCGEPTCPVTMSHSAGACLHRTREALDAERAAHLATRQELSAALAETKERQRALEVAIDERDSAFSERNWANERWEEERAEVERLKAVSERGTATYSFDRLDECPACRDKPGSPTLCKECVERRALRARVAELEREVERLRALHDLAHASKAEAEHAANVAREEVERLTKEVEKQRKWRHIAEERTRAAGAEVERLTKELRTLRGEQAGVFVTTAHHYEVTETLREAATLALGRVEDQLAHDQPEWEHDHEDAEPWDECRACTYDAMLRDVKHARAALAGSREGSPQTPRKLDAPVEYAPSLQRRTDDVRRRALAERVREACVTALAESDGDPCSLRALDLDALLEEP